MYRRCPFERTCLSLSLLFLLSSAIAGWATGLRVCIPAPAPAPPCSVDFSGLPAQAIMAPFTDGSTGEAAPVQTRAAALRDAQRLYIMVQCDEPSMATTVAKCTETDGNVFPDDCIEVFISPSGSSERYYHLVANSLGTRYDELGHNKAWDADWTVSATRDEGSWSLLFTIPFAALNEVPGEGTIWWLNIDRQRQASGKLELSSWSPTAQDFHNIQSCGRLVLDRDFGACLQRGILQPFSERAAALKQRVAVDAGLAADTEGRLAQLSESLAPVVEAAQATPSADAFAELLERGYAVLARLGDEEGRLADTLTRIENRQAMRALATPGQRALCYAVPAITDAQVLPTPQPPEAVSTELSVEACRGEYEPASFVVYAVGAPLSLECTATDLRGEKGIIPSSAVDLRSVKCWYQSGPPGRFPLNKGLRVLMAELLLKNDDLVRLDEENRENFVRLSFPDGSQKWLWVSSPETTTEERDTSVEAMPIRDSALLQPVYVPAETAKQMWVTVHVPSDAAAGDYEGEIRLATGGGEIGRMQLKVRVLPFDLEPNCLESSIYFHWGIHIDADGQGTVSHPRRNLAQYKAELRNLLAHGIDNPTVGVRYSSGLLGTVLEARREVGMRNDHLYYLVAGTGTPPEQMREIISTAREYGFEDVYFYGQDEAQGDALSRQREQWERVHEAGGKVFVAGSQGQNFPLVGDLQDLLVCYGDPSPEEAARWHGKGHKIFSYANPQSGSEVPETYRRNYGLLLWRNQYDGGMTYIYYHGWNDFNIPPYRQHNFIYPTVDGCIDTIQWEGYREGIDDLRYLATLQKAIDQARAQGGAAAEAAAEAQAFVDTMAVTGDLYELRREMVRWVLRLTRG